MSKKEKEKKEAEVRLRKVKTLGKGTFGTVYKMRSSEGTELAVKVANTDRDKNMNELNILLRLSNANIVKLKYFYYVAEKRSYNLVFELMPDGDLLHFLHDNWDRRAGGLGVYTRVFAFQMFRGLAYLASKSIMHRDIKTENMLVCKSTGVLKLTDFGCAIQENANMKYSYHVGTREFMAPELHLGAHHYTHAIDLWGAGVVLTEMAAGKPIFGIDPITAVVQMLRISNVLGGPTENDCISMGVVPVPALTSMGRTPATPKENMRRLLAASPFPDIDLVVDLVSRLCVYSPSERLTGREACDHALFQPIKHRGAKLPNGCVIAKTIDFS